MMMKLSIGLIIADRHKNLKFKKLRIEDSWLEKISEAEFNALVLKYFGEPLDSDGVRGNRRIIDADLPGFEKFLYNGRKRGLYSRPNNRLAKILSVEGVVRLYAKDYDSYAAICAGLGVSARPRMQEMYTESQRWGLCAEWYNTLYNGQERKLNAGAFERAYRHAKQRRKKMQAVFGTKMPGLAAVMDAKLCRSLKGRKLETQKRIEQEHIKKLEQLVWSLKLKNLEYRLQECEAENSRLRSELTDMRLKAETDEEREKLDAMLKCLDNTVTDIRLEIDQLKMSQL